MIRRLLLVLLIVALASGMTACGSDESGTELVAVPTRAPAATLAPDAHTVAASDAYTIVSLRDPVAAFVEQAAAGEVLDQGVIFAQVMSAQGQGCFSSGTQSGDPFWALKDMAVVRWPALDLAPWRAAVETFPNDALIAAVTAALDEAAQAYPLDEPLTVCLLPLPDPVALGTADVSHLRARLPLNAYAVNGDTVVVGCVGGESCLESVAQEVTRAYAFAAQHRAHGTALGRLRLEEWAVYEGRADAFARSLYPDTVFPWTDVYDAAGEAELWRVIVRTTGADMFQTTEAWRVYGGEGSRTAWGVVVLGARIVALYMDDHPALSFDALFDLPPSAFWAAGEAFWES